MKKSCAILAVALALLACDRLRTPKDEGTIPRVRGGRPLVTIDGEVAFTLEEYVAKLELLQAAMEQEEIPAETRMEMLEDMVKKALVCRKAIAEGYGEREDVRYYVRSKVKQVIMEAYLLEKLKDLPSPTEEDAARVYDERLKMTPQFQAMSREEALKRIRMLLAQKAVADGLQIALQTIKEGYRIEKNWEALRSMTDEEPEPESSQASNAQIVIVKDDTWLVKVNGEVEITLGDFKTLYNVLRRNLEVSGHEEDLRKELLRDLIDRHAVYLKAMEEDTLGERRVLLLERLAAQEGLSEFYLITALEKKQIEPVTDEDIEEYWRRNKKRLRGYKIREAKILIRQQLLQKRAEAYYEEMAEQLRESSVVERNQKLIDREIAGPREEEQAEPDEE